MKTRIARVLSLISYLGLIAFVMAWIVFLGNVADQHKSLWLLLFVTPLLLPLRGVLAGRGKPLIWGVLVSLLYLIHGGMEAFAGGERLPFGLIEAGLSLSYLFSASLFVRWRAEDSAQA